jgi:hypothetical protein
VSDSVKKEEFSSALALAGFSLGADTQMCLCSLDIWRGSPVVIISRGWLQDSARGFNRVSTLGTLKINEFVLKGREADLIKLAPIAAPKITVRN